MEKRALKDTSGLSGFAVVLLAILLILVSGKSFAQTKNSHSPYHTIRVVMDDDYPPFVFKDSDGHLQGILPDFWHLWEQKTGIHVQITAMDWAEAQQRMQAGEYDVIDTMFRNKEREKIYAFSNPYVKIEVPIIFRSVITGIKSVNDLKGFPVAVKSGDAAISVLRSHGITHLIEYNNYKEIVAAARDHKVNVFVVDKPPALYYLYKFGISGQFRTVGPLYSGEFHRAVLKGHTALLQVVDHGFAQISQAQFKEIERRWYGAPILSPMIRRYLWMGIGSVIAALLVLSLWVWMLRRAVSERTDGLQQEVRHRIRQENLLREQEEKYRSLFNNSGVAMFRLELEGDVALDANQKYLNLIGRTREETIGQSLLSLWVDPKEREELLGKLVDNDRITDFEMKLRHGRQEVRNCITSLRLFREDGIIEGSVVDITARKKMIEALQTLSIRQEALLAAVPDIIMEVNTDKVYTWANQAGIEFFGEDVVGRPAESFFEGEQNSYELVQPLFDGREKIIRVESWQRRKDGAVRLLAWRCKAIEDENGIVRGLLSTARDITDKKNLELDLAKREREYRTLIENLPDPVVRYNTDLNRTYVNPAWEKACEHSADKVINKHLTDIPGVILPEEYVAALKRALATGRRESVEFEWANSIGEKLFLEYYIVPEYDESGQIVSLLAIGRDITRLKRSLQQILNEQQALNDMAFELSMIEEREQRRIATVLHDVIGQDLALAKIKMGGLRKVITTNEHCNSLDEISLLLEKAIIGVRHLTGMISPPILESAGLEAALKWLARQMENDYALLVTFNDDLQPKQIPQDYRMPVYNSVRELLINVAKHANTDEAELTVCRIDGFFVVKVEDGGVGFTAESHVKNSPVDGLGLFYVQRRIISMKGTCEIDSKPGKGTCVTIKMPLTALQVTG